jgi:hypothetical protein
MRIKELVEHCEERIRFHEKEIQQTNSMRSICLHDASVAVYEKIINKIKYSEACVHPLVQLDNE